MPVCVLITGHALRSKRQAGFHHLAHALHRAGWQVVFMTTGLSGLSVLRRDYRLGCGAREEAGRLVWLAGGPEQPSGLASYCWWTPYHPANLRNRLLNRLSGGIFRRYGELPLGEVEPWIARADLLIFESVPGLMLFDRCKRLAPQARCVYRVSDDLRMIAVHPVVIAYEQAVAGRFDLVSVPSQALARKFSGLSNLAVQPHGIDAAAFAVPGENPYPSGWARQALWVGNARCDGAFLAMAAALRPDWAFHVVGDGAGLPTAANIIHHGELPFRETIPYLRHADVGLACFTYAPGAEALTDSLKIIQYTWCRLPIVAPEFIRSDRPHVFTYRPGDGPSIAVALDAAAACDRAAISTAGIRSWDELAGALAGAPAGKPAGAN